MAEQIDLKIVVDSSGAVNSIKNIKTSLNNVQGSVNKGFSGMTKGVNLFKTAIGAAAAGLAAFGVASKIQSTIDNFDNLAKSARAAGSAASEEAFKGFQVLKVAMEEAGIDAATFDRALLQTSTRLQAGLEGQKSYAAVTDKLGQSLFDLNGNLKTGPELLTTMINALNEGKITTEDFAKVVGGRAGPLIQQQFASLNQDSATLAATLKDVEANSNIVSLDAANNAELFNDTVGRLKMAMGQLLTDAVTPLLPKLTTFAQDLLAKMPAIIDKVQSAFKSLQPVFELIGTVLTEAVFPIMSKVFDVLGSIATAITPLVEAELPGLKAGFEVVSTVIETVVNFVQAAVDGFIALKDNLVAVGESIVQFKNKVTGQFDKMKTEAVESAKGLWEGVTGWFRKTDQEVVSGSIVPEMVNAVLQEFIRMETGVVQTTQSMSVNTTGILRDNFSEGNLNTIIVDPVKTTTGIVKDEFSSLESAIAGNVSGIISGSKSIKGALLDIAKTVATKGITNVLLGMLTGGMGGGGGSILGSLFGGFFADGGYLPRGKIGVTGEKGPELITGPARVIPMNKAGSVSPVFNFNITGGVSSNTRTGTVTQQDLNNMAGRILEESIAIMSQRRFT